MTGAQRRFQKGDPIDVARERLAHHAATFPPAPLSDGQMAAARLEGRWLPTDVGAAEWAVQRLSEAHNELADIKGTVAAYVGQVRAWADDQLKTGRAADLIERIAFFEATLKHYALTVRANSPLDKDGEPTVKTIKLPSGRLETKAAPDRKPKFLVSDEDALLTWAEAGAPDAIERTVNLKKLKLLVIADDDGQEWVINGDGERVAGVSFTWDDEPREPSVYIRLDTTKELTP